MAGVFLVERGRLKIFLGYAAGVGKTYAMLSEAQGRKAEGVDVVVGVALTHGRTETQKLLIGLECVPLAAVEYKGIALQECDLDALLKRAPSLAIMDELAHTNAPGSRHPKRYLDVEELLRAGIDVYTTLNIQHIESYQDTIESALGIRVRERVPDRIVEEADEIELVDIPPEELLERLKEGKVYIPDQAKRASVNFFKKETLQLLREISLRKTAAIVDQDRMSLNAAPRSDTPEDEKLGPIHLKPKLLASIGPSPFSEKVIRVTKRLADMLKADWYAVSVEIPGNPSSAQENQQIDGHLHLAESLGGVALKISGSSISGTIIAFAAAQSITQIVIGHSLRSWWGRLMHASPVDELMHHGKGIDIYVISTAGELREASPPSMRPQGVSRTYSGRLKELGISFIALAAVTAALWPLSAYCTFPMIITISFLSSMIAAANFSLLGFLNYLLWMLVALNFIYTLDFTTGMLHSEMGIFCGSIAIAGLIINRLSMHRKKLISLFQKRHSQMQDLYDVSRQLVQLSSPEEQVLVIQDHLNRLFGATTVVAIRKEPGSNVSMYGIRQVQGMGVFRLDDVEQMAIQWVINHGEKAGKGTDTMPSAKALWLPLATSGKVFGAMAIILPSSEQGAFQELISTHFENIEPYVHLLALSLARIESSPRPAL